MKTERFTTILGDLSAVGRLFYDRNWVLGTGGNFSAVVTESPLSLAITASGVHKGSLTPGDFLIVDARGRSSGGEKPSAETPIHLAIIRSTGAKAVLHTHSVWSTLLTDLQPACDRLAITGYEMLKGLSGVATHEHSEWLPVIENSQDYTALCASVETALEQHPRTHGVLLRRHGLYTWGKDIGEARRHVEILEFLFEVMGRKYSIRPSGQEG